jgi:RES domain-containing protein
MIGGGRVHDRAILDALERLQSRPIEKTVWRVARKGRDPLRGAIANGRWNAIGEFEVLYTSLEAEGALAELGFRLSLEPVWPSRIEHQIHTLKISATRALTLNKPQQLESPGVNIARYESFDYVATQAIAAAAHFLEFEALIAPSARHRALNLVVFLDRIETMPELIKSDAVDWSAWRKTMKR